MKINIKNTEVEIKSKMRAYLIYEQITNKPFNPQNFTEMMIYYYSLILANAPSIQLTFDEFINYLDDNPEVMESFNEWLVNENKMQNQFSEVKKNKVMQ